TGGCSATQQVTVLQTPVLVVHDPAPVCSPATVDLTKTIDMAKSILPAGTSFTYADPSFLQVTDPSNVSKSGNYRIFANGPTINGVQCYVEVFVNVVV